MLVLGVAYKKDIDDLRESPALTIIELLQKDGAEVSYNDPYFKFVGRGRHYDLQMECTPSTSLGEYDCVVIVTDHSDYDYQRIVREAQLVVDTRNATKGLLMRQHRPLLNQMPFIVWSNGNGVDSKNVNTALSHRGPAIPSTHVRIARQRAIAGTSDELNLADLWYILWKRGGSSYR